MYKYMRVCKCISVFSLGPIVCLDQTVVDFGNVLCGEASTTVMYIKNNSDVPTTFQVGTNTSVYQ